MMSLSYGEKSTEYMYNILHEARQPGITGCSSEYSSDASTVEKPVSLLSAKNTIEFHKIL